MSQPSTALLDSYNNPKTPEKPSVIMPALQQAVAVTVVTVKGAASTAAGALGGVKDKAVAVIGSIMSPPFVPITDQWLYGVQPVWGPMPKRT